MVKYVKASEQFNSGSYGTFDENSFVTWMYDNYRNCDYINDIERYGKNWLVFTVDQKSKNDLTADLSTLSDKYGIEYFWNKNKDRLFVSFDSALSDKADDFEYVMLNDVATTDALDYPKVNKINETTYEVSPTPTDYFNTVITVKFDLDKSNELNQYVYYIDDKGPYTCEDILETNGLVIDLCDYWRAIKGY